MAHGVSVYPPVFLWLLVPFTVLPGFLWWGIPLGLTLAALWRLRPAPWGWAVLAVAAYLWLLNPIVAGNPILWAVAFLAVGLAWPAAMPFAAVKVERRGGPGARVPARGVADSPWRSCSRGADGERNRLTVLTAIAFVVALALGALAALLVIVAVVVGA